MTTEPWSSEHSPASCSDIPGRGLSGSGVLPPEIRPGAQADEQPPPVCVLPSGSGDERGDDVSGVPVQGGPGPLWRMVVRGSAWEAASCPSRSGTPASKLGGGDERVS